MRSTLEDNKAYDLDLQNAAKGRLMSIAISGALTIPAKPPFIVKIDPTGAQNVTCPTKGSRFMFIVIHGSTNNADLTIKDSAATTIGTLSQNEIGMVVDDGVATFFGVWKQT